jgi:acyl-CoA reductase-like NAD-dependent aldehyde dehydrogenase
MISEKEAERLEGWIRGRGGRRALLCGGKREGAMLEATLLEDVPRGRRSTPRRRSARSPC